MGHTFRHSDLHVCIKLKSGKHTSVWVLQQSENIIRPAIYREAQVLTELWQMDHEMRVSINYKRQQRLSRHKNDFDDDVIVNE